MSLAGAQQEIAWVLRYVAHVWQTPWQIKTLYQKVLAVFEEVGDERGIVETLYRLGWATAQLGDYQEATQRYLDSLARAKKLNRREIILNCLVELGYVQWALGNNQDAVAYCHESLSISAEIGYRSQIASAKRYLARISLSQGDSQMTRQYVQDSLAIYEELGLCGLKADTLGEMGHVALVEQDLVTARQLAKESLALCQELEHRTGEITPYTVLGEAALGLGDFETAGHHFRQALQIACEVWQPALALHALVGLAHLLAAGGDKAQAYEAATAVMTHSASWQWSRDRVSPLAADLETALPAAVVMEIAGRTQERTLKELVEQVTSDQVLDEVLRVAMKEQAR